MARVEGQAVDLALWAVGRIDSLSWLGGSSFSRVPYEQLAVVANASKHVGVMAMKVDILDNVLVPVANVGCLHVGACFHQVPHANRLVIRARQEKPALMWRPAEAVALECVPGAAVLGATHVVWRRGGVLAVVKYKHAAARRFGGNDKLFGG